MQSGACDEFIQETKELREAISLMAVLLVSKYHLAFDRKCAPTAYVPWNLPDSQIMPGQRWEQEKACVFLV